MQVQLKDAKAAEERQAFIQDNKGVQGYDAEAGKKLASVACNKPTGYKGAGGYCSEGVDDSLKQVYGTCTGVGSAYQAADILASDEGIGAYFEEVEGVSREDLKSLPEGYIVVWHHNRESGGNGVSEAGKVHGHISICLGDGRESSDYIWPQTYKRDASYRVFCPTA